MRHSATRALAILRAMNQRSVSSVRHLAHETGISKPSIVRLLGILIEDGYVRRAAGAGSYMLTENVLHLSTGFRSDLLIERAAETPMEELTARVGWPTALGMFEKGMMVVRYSTIASTHLAWYRSTLHHRLAPLDSAMGLAFLAFCAQPERTALLSSLLDEPRVVERFENQLAQVRIRGHAVRLPTAEHPTLSLSVPIFHERRVRGALSVTLFGKAMTADTAADRYVVPLRAAVGLIETRWPLVEPPDIMASESPSR